MKCKPADLQQFTNEVSAFDPPADSTHLSQLAAESTLDHAESFAASITDESFTTSAADESFTMSVTDESFAVSITDESFAMSTADESFATSTTDESFATSTADESFTTSAANSSMPSFDLSHSFDNDLDDVTLGSFDIPDLSSEESIDESLPRNAVPADPPPVEYFIIPSSSICEKDKLADNLGFSYTVKQSKCEVRHPGMPTY